MQDVSASSEVQISEERKTSELMALEDETSTDQESMDRENEGKRSVYMTESSWDENDTVAATDREIPSKEPATEQKNQEQDSQVTNLFYLLAGVLAGFGCILVIRRKK